MDFTTLVPAYKSDFLIDLLIAIKNQKKRPAAVIFSDDSPDLSFAKSLLSEPLISLTQDMNVTVIAGPNTGAYNNFRHLLNYYINLGTNKTELFHILLDDDVIFPTFYERHLFAHNMLNVPCAVSRRWTSLTNGQPLHDNLPIPEIIKSHPSRILSIDGDLLFKLTVGQCKNWLGEFSNTTFKSDCASLLLSPTMSGIDYTGLEDLGGFLKVSMGNSIAFINEYLGYFRTSELQNSANPMGRPLKLAFLAYISLNIIGKRLGKLTVDEFNFNIREICNFILHYYGNEDDMISICDVLKRLPFGENSIEEEFIINWDAYRNN